MLETTVRDRVEKKIEQPMVRAIFSAALDLFSDPAALNSSQEFSCNLNQYELRFYERADHLGHRVFCLSVWQKQDANLPAKKEANSIHPFESGEIAFRVFILKREYATAPDWVMNSYSETRAGYEKMGLSLALFLLSDQVIEHLLAHDQDMPDLVCARVTDQAKGKVDFKNSLGWTSDLATFAGYHYSLGAFEKYYSKEEV